MTLEQLRIFVGVAEREHVTAAARDLNVTQSAASAAIAALEERHDVKLFHRAGRGISLTDAGRIFLDEARAVLARAAAAQLALDEISGLKRGTLRMVASQTIAAYWLPPILAAYRLRYPSLAIELDIGNTEQAAARVLDGSAELGIVEGEVHDVSLNLRKIGQDRLVLVQAAPLEGPLDAKALTAARWVMREVGSGTRSTFDAAIRRFGINPAELDVALVLPSNESVRTATEAGAGIAALSGLVVAPALAAGTLHELPLDLGVRPFYWLCRKDRFRSGAACALADLMKERSQPRPFK
jgi:DNA-binding transcriptional LysR family regulator